MMKPGLSWPSVVATLIAVAATAAPATAQVRLSLQGGFAPDPFELGVEVSANTRAESAVRGCPGWIGSAPALVIDYTNPGTQLNFAIEQAAGGAQISGLILAAPDGIYRCVTLDAEGRGVVRVDPAQSGGHMIWPTVTEAGPTASARILVSQRAIGGPAPGPAVPMSDGLQAAAPPAAGTHSVPAEGDVAVALTLLPTQSVADIAAECWGRIDPSRPDAVFRLDAGAERLELRARSDTDTTMVVIGPDGARHCNDDTYGLDPAVTLTPAGGGAYAVWVGTYGDEPSATAMLHATTGGAVASGLNVDAAPAGGRHFLAAGEEVEVALDVAPTAAVTDFAPECWGRIDPTRPDAVISLEAAQERLELRAFSDSDTTMVVLDPVGGRHCNDDTYGLDPAVTLMPAGSGDYAVWVGTYEDSQHAAARLVATAGGTPEVGPAGEVHPFGGGELTLALSLQPGASASDFGSDCWGQVRADGPDAVIRLDTARDMVEISATGPVDTTLVVQGPDGTVHCNDDTYGLDPAVALRPAAAGDYAVRVGTFGGEAASVTLRVAETAGGAGGFGGATDFGGGFSGPEDSPFLGQDLPTAVAALEFLESSEGLGEFLTYDRIEPQGTEGFTLHGVTIIDPSGESPPLDVERMRVSDLDLEGLTATGAPGRFVIAMEGIDYASLIEALNAEGMMPPVPAVPGNPPLSSTLSLLPLAGDATRRVMSADVNLEGQLAIAFEARMRWPEGVGIPEDVASAPTEAMSLELRNYGFLGTLLATQAVEMGMDPAGFGRFMVETVRAMLAPITPGSPGDQLVTALAQAAEAGLDRPGVLRLRLASDSPQGLEALFAELEGGALLDSLDHGIEISFEPLQ